MKGPSKNRFETIFRDGKRVQGETVRLIAQPGTGLVGIATAKKIGARPQRNRAKRRAREAVRKASVHPGLDYVVVITPGATEVEFSRLVDDLGSAFQKMRERWASELESS